MQANYSGVLITKFGAPGCSACDHVQAAIDQLCEEEGCKQDYIDVEQDPRAAQRYRVRGLPTIIFERNGEFLGQHVGMASTTQLRQILEDM